MYLDFAGVDALGHDSIVLSHSSTGSLRNLATLLLAAAGEPAPAPFELRLSPEEARQGVAFDALHIYAIDNSRSGKCRINDDRRVARRSGDAAIFAL